MSETPTAYRRSSRSRSREVRRALSSDVAASAICPLRKGCEVFDLRKGQFSLIDVIEHCLGASGPADVVMATWTAAGAELGTAAQGVAGARWPTWRLLLSAGKTVGAEAPARWSRDSAVGERGSVSQAARAIASSGSASADESGLRTGDHRR